MKLPHVAFRFFHKIARDTMEILLRDFKQALGVNRADRDSENY